MSTLKWVSWMWLACMALPLQAAGFQTLNNDAHFPEGPIWFDGKLYYVEYDRNTIMVWDGKANHTFATLPGCGPSAVLNTARQEFVVTCYDNNSIGRVSLTGQVLPSWDHDHDGNHFVAPNDFGPDAHGGLYFTASGHAGTASDGAVYYVSADGTITRAATDLHNANGLVVSRDGATLYVVETDVNDLLSFKIGPDGHLSERRVFLNMDELTHHVGRIWPDGVKMDSRGVLYIGQTPRDPHAALAGTIFVVDTKRTLLRSITLPSPGVPNFAFSPDERTLYVTAVDQLDKSPYKGKLYSVANE